MTNYRKVRVGTLKVTEPREVTEYYECAAWHKTVRCEPGEYPVYAYLTWCDIAEGTLGHTLYAPFEGAVTSACFVSRIGAHYGSDRGSELVGTQDRGSVRLSTYALDGAVTSGTLELDPALIAAEPYEVEGRKYVFYRLARRVASPATDADKPFLDALKVAEVPSAAA